MFLGLISNILAFQLMISKAKFAVAAEKVEFYGCAVASTKSCSQCIHVQRIITLKSDGLERRKCMFESLNSNLQNG